MQLYLFVIDEEKEYRETALFVCKYCAGSQNAMSPESISHYLKISKETVIRQIEEAIKDGYSINACRQGFYVPDIEDIQGSGGEDIHE